MDTKISELTARFRALRPETMKGVEGPWLKFEDAVALKGVKPATTRKDKYIIFALQGAWKGGLKVREAPTADDTGMVAKDSIVMDDPTPKNRATSGLFNYAVYLPTSKLWVDANVHSEYVDQKGRARAQEFYVRKHFVGQPIWDQKKKKHVVKEPYVNYNDQVYHGVVFYAYVIRDGK